MSLNRALVFLAMLITYLGLSKSLSPSEFGISYVFNEESLSKLVNGAPVTVVLTDTHSTGFIIKTYYHKYKVIYGFQTYDELIVRASRAFTLRHADNIGMSIFRRNEELKESFAPMPPGSVFIGDRDFGRWVMSSKGKVWRFYRAYRYLPQSLGIENFEATYAFYQEAQIRQRENRPFYGLNNEFGVNGPLTKEQFPAYFKKDRGKEIDLKGYFADFLKKNFYRR